MYFLVSSLEEEVATAEKYFFEISQKIVAVPIIHT